jgi:hypothetical protein
LNVWIEFSEPAREVISLNDIQRKRFLKFKELRESYDAETYVVDNAWDEFLVTFSGHPYYDLITAVFEMESHV